MLAWGQEFTVEGLWNDPRCLCSSVQVLYQRLKKYPPEKACVPDLWRLWGKTWRNLWEISKCDKCQVPYSTLKDRVGRMKIPIHLAVQSETECWSPGNSAWKQWLSENTSQSHGCIILITPNTLGSKLLCQIYEMMLTGKRKPGVLHNTCGNPQCINPAHYHRGYPRCTAKRRGWVKKESGYEYVPKAWPHKPLTS
jgi:hypothetical protein